MPTGTQKVGSITITEDGPTLRIRDRPGQGGDSTLLTIGGMGLFFIAFAMFGLDGLRQILLIVFGLVVMALPVAGFVLRLRGLDTIIVDRSSGTVTQGETPAAISGVLEVDVSHAIEFRRDEDGHEVGKGYPVWSAVITDGHQTFVIAKSKSRHDIVKIRREVGVLIGHDPEG